jgi:hypothetical protein
VRSKAGGSLRRKALLDLEATGLRCQTALDLDPLSASKGLDVDHPQRGSFLHTMT